MPPGADQIRCTFQPLEPAIALATAAEDHATWLCVGKAGTFWHPKYNKFALTVADFQSMVDVFNSGAYPEPPTELVVDYDHRSLRAQNPEDAKAAGWIKNLELRAEGQELWARVEFTPPALEKLRNKEFRFLSGVFAPKWKNFRAKELGSTFLGLAITNMPTLHHLDPIALSMGAAIPVHATDSFPHTLTPADDLGFHEPQKEPRMAAKKNDEKTITVKAADGQDVTIALSALAGLDDVIALGRSQAPDPATIVARADFDALQSNVVQLSTELADERTKRESAEQRMHEQAVDVAIADFVRSGHIAPVERDVLRKMALSNRTDFDAYMAVKPRAIALNREQGSGSRAKDEAPGYVGASESLRTQAEAYALANKVPFADAVIAVSTTTAFDAVTDRAIALRREHAL